MANIHMILQGKGGVGKSTIATLIGQYLLHHKHPALCVDADPVNKSFCGYEALDVKALKLLVDGEIDSRQFDELVSLMFDANKDVIVDNGASSFTQISSYLLNNQIADMLSEAGHSLIIHTVITGGPACSDTLHGFNSLVSQFSEKTRFVVWLNPFWGAIELNGKKFFEMSAYLKNESRISCVIELPKLKQETFGYDFAEMLKTKTTFDKAIASPQTPIMTRQRLKMIQRQVFEQLDASTLLSLSTLNETESA